MKKLVSFSILFFIILWSCNTEKEIIAPLDTTGKVENSKITLTEEKLYNLFKADNEIKNYILLSKQSYVTFVSNVNKLSKTDKNMLGEASKKFVSYEEFTSKADAATKNVWQLAVEKIQPINKHKAQILNKFLKTYQQKYTFDKVIFAKVLTKIHAETLTNTPVDNKAKVHTQMDCVDFCDNLGFEIEVQEVNMCVNNGYAGSALDACFNRATLFGAFASLGCLHGCSR